MRNRKHIQTTFVPEEHPILDGWYDSCPNRSEVTRQALIAHITKEKERAYFEEIGAQLDRIEAGMAELIEIMEERE